MRSPYEIANYVLSADVDRFPEGLGGDWIDELLPRIRIHQQVVAKRWMSQNLFPVGIFHVRKANVPAGVVEEGRQMRHPSHSID